jgi:hypothetical protein
MGTVYNSVTNAPIAHAMVQAPGQPNVAAFTGPDGRFEIQHVAAGSVMLNAEKPGYFSAQELSQGVPMAGQGTTFTVGEDSRDVRLKLVPEAHIEGHIINSDNEPISGLQVFVMGEQIVEGWKRPMFMGSASTNAAGHFRVDGLKPGHYFLHTGSRQMFQSAPPDSGVNIGYAERFYPAAPDQASAQPLDVRAGETVQADMQLPPERFHQISGTVVGASAGENVFVGISTEWGGITGSGLDPKTGRFKISPVFPGVWKVVAQAGRGGRGGAAGSVYGEQEVRVTGSDVNDVQIEMHPGVNIPLLVDMPPSGQNQAQNQATSANWMPPIQLASIDQGASQQMVVGPEIDNSTSQPSRFFHNVRPGSYRVRLWAQGMCADSVTSGNTDLVHGTLNVQAGITPQPIHVVMGAACAKLSGTVSDNDGDGKGMVVLVPLSAASAPLILNIMPNKSFAMQGLSPGDYRIFAVTDLTGLEYANPQAILTIPNKEIHLDPNQTTQVDLELHHREAQ